ncbi:MAG: hypothetical protein ACFFG0_48625, partial [Candidatus Thorarchaeota archaeon]
RNLTTLKEFFRLLDASIATNKILPLEAFAQHLGLTLNELVEQLERINWSDVQPDIPEEPVDKEPFKLPIHIEKNKLNISSR